MILTDQVALITGAGRGIGRGVAARLAEAGASIAVVDIDSEAAERSASEIQSTASVRTCWFNCDVSDYSQVSPVVDKTIEQFGRLDILVNNAGITRDSLIMRMKPEDWNLVLQVNLTGAFNFIRAVSRQMTRQRSGAIVNISSVVGLMGNAGQANYAASKAGLVGLTKSAAKEFASRGIRVNAVAPGLILPPAGQDESYLEKLANCNPLNRYGGPDDITAAVLFLLRSRFVTGQVIYVDGGYHMKGHMYD